MKKILSLVPYTFLPAKTGGQKSIASFYQNLSLHFTLVCIGTKKNDASKASYQMKNILSGSSLKYADPFNFFRIRNIIREEKPDYFQIEHPYIGWLAIMLKKFTGVKLIVRSHNIEGLRFKTLDKWWWKLLMKYEGWVHRHATINYFISDADRAFAIDQFNLPANNAFTITFGIDRTAPPSLDEHLTAKAFLVKEHKLNTNDVIVLFNGAFDYRPNTIALYNLVEKIFPVLGNLSIKSFKLIVCGKDIPEDIISNNSNADIIFAGFVPDINVYLTGATVFVNPITEGGGIKTKLVEALGFNLNCVSFETGALGVSQALCGEKLTIVEDNDWRNFASFVADASFITSNTPDAFYNQFSYINIMEKIKGIL